MSSPTTAWSSWRCVILGDLTFATFHARGHGAGSAAPTDNAAWIVIRWRRGKAVWWRTFNARAEALEAVGLSEHAGA